MRLTHDTLLESKTLGEAFVADEAWRDTLRGSNVR
jgi:hypothetical protein